MSRNFQHSRLNMQAFAQEGVPLSARSLIADLPRLAEEVESPQDAAIDWQAHAELRPHASGEDQVWLHLAARCVMPLTCQRCLHPMTAPLEVDQWYRFVATEEIAMAEDDQSDEDLLVMEPLFDLQALLEDELLMAMPAVPMHGECPGAPLVQSHLSQPASALDSKPNPFLVLEQLKRK